MIYKYFKVTEHSLSNMIRNELFCQNYMGFNDPFECWFTLKEGIPHPEKEVDRYKAACETWGYTPGDLGDGFDDYFLYMEEIETYQPDILGYVEGAKISCFSKEGDNLLMWAHYADGLRGFCIEYDENQLLFDEKEKKAVIIPVSYKETPPIVDKIVYALAEDQVWYHEMAIGENPNDSLIKDYERALKGARKTLNDLYIKTIATKPIQWKYEKEVRLVYYSENKSGEFFHFPSHSIKTIFFGERMDSKVRDTLCQIIDMKNLPIQKKIAKRNAGNYKIEFETFG